MLPVMMDAAVLACCLRPSSSSPSSSYVPANAKKDQSLLNRKLDEDTTTTTTTTTIARTNGSCHHLSPSTTSLSSLSSSSSSSKVAVAATRRRRRPADTMPCNCDLDLAGKWLISALMLLLLLPADPSSLTSRMMMSPRPVVEAVDHIIPTQSSVEWYASSPSIPTSTTPVITLTTLTAMASDLDLKQKVAKQQQQQQQQQQVSDSKIVSLADPTGVYSPLKVSQSVPANLVNFVRLQDDHNTDQTLESLDFANLSLVKPKSRTEGFIHSVLLEKMARPLAKSVENCHDSDHGTESMHGPSLS